MAWLGARRVYLACFIKRGGPPVDFFGVRDLELITIGILL
jgi:hypothetical protein